MPLQIKQNRLSYFYYLNKGYGIQAVVLLPRIQSELIYKYHWRIQWGGSGGWNLPFFQKICKYYVNIAENYPKFCLFYSWTPFFTGPPPL
jgi:hypothetical protein